MGILKLHSIRGRVESFLVAKVGIKTRDPLAEDEESSALPVETGATAFDTGDIGRVVTWLLAQGRVRTQVSRVSGRHGPRR